MNRMNPCVIIPVYNHSATLIEVARSAGSHAPVIVVDDGSTDGARELLEVEPGIVTIFEPVNRGKGRALKSGFDRARELGYTHAITVDADGQHDPAQIPDFLSVIAKHPEALFVGSRELREAGASRARRFANAFSNFWHWIETGRHLPDTQCGFRAYPLGPIRPLCPASDGYGFELEILVHAAWIGIETRTLPIRVVYGDSISQSSHFRPGADFARISAINARLTFQALALPPAVRRAIAAREEGTGLERTAMKAGACGRVAHRVKHRAELFFSANPAPPGRAAASFAVGLLFGLLPLWGARDPLVAALIKVHVFSSAFLSAGFDLTRPLAPLLPLLFAAAAAFAPGLDFFLPADHIILCGFAAWSAACLTTVLAAGVAVYVFARRLKGATLL